MRRMAPLPSSIIEAPATPARQQAERILRTTARSWGLDYPGRPSTRNSFLKTHWAAAPRTDASCAWGAGLLAARA